MEIFGIQMNLGVAARVFYPRDGAAAMVVERSESSLRA